MHGERGWGGRGAIGVRGPRTLGGGGWGGVVWCGAVWCVCTAAAFELGCVWRNCMLQGAGGDRGGR